MEDGSRRDREDLARLRWRCRRGMRELDVLLLRYLDEEHAGATPAERAAFELLLSAQDPEIVDLLAGRLRAEDEAVNAIIQRLLARARP